ncbi:MAG: PIN domain-containing protein, partial [Deltaproteobacteria bacterium]|nr:PIN domain-containing protein [Deltaproteobacteria bacterium]
MIIDTDVLIWYMKGNEKAYEIIEKTNTFFISVVTYIELVQGMRNKKELNNLRKALRGWNSQILYISEEVSAKAMFYVEQ